MRQWERWWWGGIGGVLRNSFGTRLSGGGGRRGEFGVCRLIIRELKLAVGSTLGMN